MEPTGFKELPMELVLHLAEFVRGRTVVCLSLTCKDLFNNHRLRKFWTPPLPQEGRSWNHYVPAFKVLLETPNLLYCGYCGLLHPIKSTTNLCQEQRTRGRRCPTAGKGIHFPVHNKHIAFQDIYNVMRCHQRGAKYGGDLIEKLSIHDSWIKGDKTNTTHKETWRKLDVTSQFSSHCLILHSCQRLFLPGNQRKAFLAYKKENLIRQYSAELEKCLARYLTCCGHDPKRRTYALTNAYLRTMTSGQVTSRVWQCSECPRERRISMWDHGTSGVEVALDAWVNLGYCVPWKNPGDLGESLVHPESRRSSKDDVFSPRWRDYEYPSNVPGMILPDSHPTTQPFKLPR